MKLEIDVRIKVSRFIKFFVLSDFILMSGWGLVNPIFSIFIINNIAGATLLTVGITSSIYWLVKSLIQIPIANFLDKTDGDRDDFYVLLTALILAGISAFSFPFIYKVWHLYLLQVVHAIAFGLYVPSWSSLFSHHLDSKHHALDWALSSTSMGIAVGLTGVIGGAIANSVGFAPVFIAAAILSFGAAVVISMAPDLVFPNKKSDQHQQEFFGPKSNISIK